MHCIKDEVSVFRSSLRRCGALIKFDLVFLIRWGFSSWGESGIFCVPLLVRFYFIWMLNFGVKKYLWNNCHQAANFRTNSWLLIGEVFFIIAGTLWGGVSLPLFALVSATSSYVDDIAFTKILCEQDLMWHPQLQGRGVRFFVLSEGGFDFLLLLTGIFRCCDLFFFKV